MKHPAQPFKPVGVIERTGDRQHQVDCIFPVGLTHVEIVEAEGTSLPEHHVARHAKRGQADIPVPPTVTGNHADQVGVRQVHVPMPGNVVILSFVERFGSRDGVVKRQFNHVFTGP